MLEFEHAFRLTSGPLAIPLILIPNPHCFSSSPTFYVDNRLISPPLLAIQETLTRHHRPNNFIYNTHHCLIFISIITIKQQ